MEQQKKLPAIPVRGIVALPGNDFKIEIGRDFSKNAILESETSYGNLIVLTFQYNVNTEDVLPTKSDISNIGLLARFDMKVKLGNGNFKIKFTSFMRCEIEELLNENGFYEVIYKELNPVYGNKDEEDNLFQRVQKIVNDNPGGLLRNTNIIKDELNTGITIDQFADLVAFNLNLPDKEKYKYLETADVNQRLIYILADFEKLNYFKELDNKINNNIKESIEDSQKEYYLREKMRAIQEELGDKAKKESDIDKLRQAILDAKMPKEVEKKALNELQRYEQTPSAAGEASVIRTYLDTLIEIPWHKETVDELDINKAKDKLNETHFGLEKVKGRVLEYLGVKLLTGKNPQTILCLVGPPGVGKTSLAASIASALGRVFVKQSLGGVKDEAEIRGHRRTYLGALPGRIINGMRKAKVINPLFLLDEIDKLGADYKGDPSAALLEVLDPEQNKFFSDHYVEEQYDLSHVLFIMTANNLENIPEPLRDRMEIIELSSYTEIEKFHIAKTHLIDRQLESNGLDKDKFNLTDDGIMAIIKYYTREAGVRQLERHIGTLVRKSITKILGEKKESVTISEANIEEYLGKKIFFNNMAETKDLVGIVTGLAYTQYGGDTLEIEATTYKGRGNILLTGKLGDVMKESAQAALSFVKSNALKYGIDADVFEKTDIHIHVPEGAVPKDGPSAGVAITTALVSAFTGKKVSHEIGMTGEVTLRGRVLPIGGLKEKSIAALRSGLKKILIPLENQRDLEDIPQEVRDKLQIEFVETVDDVLNKALVK